MKIDLMFTGVLMDILVLFSKQKDLKTVIIEHLLFKDYTI